MMTRKAHLQGGLLRQHATLAAILLIAGVSSAQPCGWSEFTGPGPEARYDHAAAYDSRRDVVVVFGGFSPGPIGARQDTWEWNGIEWSRVATSGPNPRYVHSMAYDSTRGVCVLFGGWDAIRQDEANDTWEWDGVVWRQAATTGPSPRYDHAMAFDSNRGVCVLFGGYQIGPGELGDTWEWDGASWTQVSTTGPRARREHAMAYDEERDVVILFGGLERSNLLGDTWIWDGREWTQRSDQGPQRRVGHGMTFHADRRSVLLAGGLLSIMDVWEWNGDSWAQLGEGGTRAQTNHSFVYHAGSQSTMMFGGAVEDPGSHTWLWSQPCIWLSVRSSCPSGGPAEIAWRYATPSSRVAILAAEFKGSFTIPNGLPCAGLRLGLASVGLQVVLTAASDSDGSRTLRLQAPQWACGMYLQLVERPGCIGSNVVRMAP